MKELRKVHGFRLPKRWPTVEEIAAHQSRVSRMLASPPPSPATLGKPIIDDQGQTGECFGFATAQAIGIYGQASESVTTHWSPIIPYWAARREEVATDADVSDSGSDPDGMTSAIADFGACTWDELPFAEAAVNDRPADVALLAAQKMRCRIVPILSTGSQLYAAVQHAISVERLPVLIALNVVPAFDDPPASGVIDDPSGESRGLHANCLFGWDSRGALDANSWGVGEWTPDGTAVLTANFLAGAVVWAGTLEVLS